MKIYAITATTDKIDSHSNSVLFDVYTNVKLKICSKYTKFAHFYKILSAFSFLISNGSLNFPNIF